MTAAPASLRAYRLTSIDMLRGLVIVIMALDHVRDYFMPGSATDPTADPHVSPLLFGTRWITHFCAPVFVLLAGTSAGMMASRKSPPALARFLVSRGLWLIVVEWFVVSTAFTFAPLGMEHMHGFIAVYMQVIWAIGASLIILAAAQYLGHRACLLFGTAIVVGHNLLDAIWPAGDVLAPGQPLWVALHAQMSVAAGPFLAVFVYPLLPWTGVMLFGYGIAPAFALPPRQRNRWLLAAGVALTIAFLAVRALNVYGDPSAWHAQPGGTAATIMSFLNTTKYPPSLQYLLMTLGPAALLCSFADRMSGAPKDALLVFGRVPFAFYIAHLYLVHTLSVLLGFIQGFDARRLLSDPTLDPLPGFGVSLAGVYIVWLLVVALMYPFCRWVAAVKARRSDWWLSYL